MDQEHERYHQQGGELTVERAHGPRRSVLDLAPLELDCMNTLWPLGEATVREIRDRLAERRARAYTTIMTIMDRLARKGIVERRKSGRKYVYRARLSAEEARTHALEQVLENFFGGSRQRMIERLDALWSARDTSARDASARDASERESHDELNAEAVER
jgi:BlaI family penicillinase repressor